jgi:hypothetical protein
MSSKFSIGAKVQWQWLGRPILGVVEEIFFEPVTKSIKGKNIKRNGSKENPAYLFKSDAGNIALKLGAELQSRKETTGKKPTLFR